MTEVFFLERGAVVASTASVPVMLRREQRSYAPVEGTVRFLSPLEATATLKDSGTALVERYLELRARWREAASDAVDAFGHEVKGRAVDLPGEEAPPLLRTTDPGFVRALVARFRWAEVRLGKKPGPIEASGLVFVPAQGAGKSAGSKAGADDFVALMVRRGTYAPWALTPPPFDGSGHLPRLVRQVRQQQQVSMAYMPVDTGHRWPDARPESAQHRGWDNCFGAASQRERPRFDEGWKQRAVGVRLKSVEASGGWIPWVLAYTQCVGVDKGRVLSTLRHAPPRVHEDLASMQANANATWDERKVFPHGAPGGGNWASATFWDLSDAALLSRLQNGMCPHDPHLVKSEGGKKGFLVWSFTWTGRGKEPRFGQDGLYHLDFDLSERGLGSARLPDLEVWTNEVALGDEGEPVLDGEVRLERIRLRFPGEKDFTEVLPPKAVRVEPSGSKSPPGPGNYTTAWDFAKWFVRQAILLSGQIDWHLGRSHIVAEQICGVLCSHLRKADVPDDPFLKALWPFLRSADEINAFGDLTLISASGVLATASPLRHDATLRRMRLQRASWASGTPARRRRLTTGDDFASGSAAAWQACEAWANTHCPVPDSSVQSTLATALEKLDAAIRGKDEPNVFWGAAGDPPEELPDGATVHRLNEAVHDQELDWKRLAARIVYTTSFLHGWVGGEQLRDMGNVFSAATGHRWSGLPVKEGQQLTAEQADAVWRDGGPLPDHVGFALALSELIGRSDWGRYRGPYRAFGEDPQEEKDVFEAFYAKLEAAAGDAGLPEDSFGGLRPRINI